MTAEKGRYNIMAASRREVGEAVVARKGGKGKPIRQQSRRVGAAHEKCRERIDEWSTAQTLKKRAG